MPNDRLREKNNALSIRPLLHVMLLFSIMPVTNRQNESSNNNGSFIKKKVTCKQVFSITHLKMDSVQSCSYVHN